MHGFGLSSFFEDSKGTFQILMSREGVFAFLEEIWIDLYLFPFERGSDTGYT